MVRARVSAFLLPAGNSDWTVEGRAQSCSFRMPKTSAQKPTSTIKKPKKVKERAAPAEDTPAVDDPQAPDEPAHTSDGRVAKQPKVIVILEGACLETGKVGKDHVLLNCDDHQGFLRKHNREPAESRPDILHQMMLILLDSPLNKAGLLRLYVRTAKARRSYGTVPRPAALSRRACRARRARRAYSSRSALRSASRAHTSGSRA